MCVSVTLSVNSPTGQTPQRIVTVDSLKDADLRKDVTGSCVGTDVQQAVLLRPATETSWVVSYGSKTIPRWRTAAILTIDISPLSQ